MMIEKKVNKVFTIYRILNEFSFPVSLLFNELFFSSFSLFSLEISGYFPSRDCVQCRRLQISHFCLDNNDRELCWGWR